MLFGYARVSTPDQDLSIQVETLKKAGCEIIREEKMSGATRKGRSELEILLTFVRAGDTLVVTRIDRLARSVRDLQNIIHDLKERGVSLVATEQKLDTSTPMGKLMADMLGIFAEFEHAIRRDRQLEGIAKAKAKGRYKGGSPHLDRERIRLLVGQGKPISKVAREIGVSRASIYKVMREGGNGARP